MSNANFKVDPKLASLLGENYRSTELAIKELIDNAFDADAGQVEITLPKPLTTDPIVILDNGSGMTEAEVRNEYLNIASSRVSRKGELTPKRKRVVKGRKGIGKFAGLMVASLMELRTRARGTETTLRIWRDDLVKTHNDLVQVNLPISTKPCDPNLNGTEIVLRGINQNFTFPNADKLKRILVLEYGRRADFRIAVNEEWIDIEDIPGDSFEHTIQLDEGETATLRFTISDGRKSLPQSGVAFRVGGKIVGNPQYFGIDETEDVPPKLLKRIYGEVLADSLEQDVTADWGSIIDNSKLYLELKHKIRPLLEQALGEVYDREVTLSKTRLKRRLENWLDNLPEFRRAHAKRVLDKVLKKFYGESESRIVSVLSIMFESFAENDYWTVMQDLEEARQGEVSKMATAFSQFGMIDVALITQQTAHRITVLNELEKLVFNPEAQVSQILQALSNNLWVLGNQFSMASTNPELSQVVEMYLSRNFDQDTDLPNLLLLQDFNKGFILLYLKHPEEPVELLDRRLSKEYQADLAKYLPGRDIDVLVIGGALSQGLVHQRAKADIKFVSYKAMISDARVQLNWMLEELKKRG
ncbi:ATP-binding protein [Pontibacter sp. G13]|uniref:ATP-binding protein n=1 Tax=Pontibacter sp. G13 TaxID=3074898 RepID=UPI00288A3BA5|nr:ATP-binding protein [Pontibacter sp. G13]WNJ16052.1 ATP-binding protein [Pontibacter sp. G13]